MSAHSDSQQLPNTSTTDLLRRLFGVAWRFRANATWVLLLNIALVSFNLGSLSFTGVWIDVLKASLVPSTVVRWPLGWQPPTAWTPFATIVAVSLIVLLFSLLNAVLKYITAMASARLSQQMVVHLRAEVYNKLQRLSFRFFDTHDSSGIIGRVAGDVQAIRQFVDGVILKVLTVVLALGVFLA